MVMLLGFPPLSTSPSGIRLLLRYCFSIEEEPLQHIRLFVSFSGQLGFFDLAPLGDPLRGRFFLNDLSSLFEAFAYPSLSLPPDSPLFS